MGWRQSRLPVRRRLREARIAPTSCSTSSIVGGNPPVGLANGVVRLEFAQLRRSTDGETRMIPEPVATVMVPV